MEATSFSEILAFIYHITQRRSQISEDKNILLSYVHSRDGVSNLKTGKITL